MTFMIGWSMERAHFKMTISRFPRNRFGSKEGQEAFNALEGSIPVRTDVDKGKLGAYQRWSMASFDHDVLLASCVHGEAVPATFRQELNDRDQLVCGRQEGSVATLNSKGKWVR
jgi:hypothetical protein